VAHAAERYGAYPVGRRVAGEPAGDFVEVLAGQADAPARPCALEWVRGLRDFFRGRSAVFVKQLGSCPTRGGLRLRLKDGHGGDWREWPDDLRVREVPLPPLTAACA
jgi:hypothetical protein